MLDPHAEAYVAAIVESAERDASIARVLREICALEGSVRAAALALVGTHLRTRGVGRLDAPVGREGAPEGREFPPVSDVFECLEALRRDDIARRIAERLGPPG